MPIFKSAVELICVRAARVERSRTLTSEPKNGLLRCASLKAWCFIRLKAYLACLRLAQSILLCSFPPSFAFSHSTSTTLHTLSTRMQRVEQSSHSPPEYFFSFFSLSHVVIDDLLDILPTKGNLFYHSHDSYPITLAGASQLRLRVLVVLAESERERELPSSCSPLSITHCLWKQSSLRSFFFLPAFLFCLAPSGLCHALAFLIVSFLVFHLSSVLYTSFSASEFPLYHLFQTEASTQDFFLVFFCLACFLLSTSFTLGTHLLRCVDVAKIFLSLSFFSLAPVCLRRCSSVFSASFSSAQPLFVTDKVEVLLVCEETSGAASSL